MKNQLFFFLSIFFLFSILLPFKQLKAQTIDETLKIEFTNQTHTGSVALTCLGGQSFTSTNPHQNISSISLLKMTQANPASPSSTAYIKIARTSIDGPYIATSSEISWGTSTSTEWKNFSFSSRVELLASTTYYLKFCSTYSANNMQIGRRSTVDQYTLGSAYSGSSPVANQDYNFKIYENTSCPSSPSATSTCVDTFPFLGTQRINLINHWYLAGAVCCLFGALFITNRDEQKS